MERTFSFIVGKHKVTVVLEASKVLITYIQKNAAKKPDIENKTFDDVEKTLRKILSDLFFEANFLENDYTLNIKLARSSLLMQSKALLSKSKKGKYGSLKIVDTGTNFRISPVLSKLIKTEVRRLFE